MFNNHLKYGFNRRMFIGLVRQVERLTKIYHCANIIWRPLEPTLSEPRFFAEFTLNEVNMLRMTTSEGMTEKVFFQRPINKIMTDCLKNTILLVPFILLFSGCATEYNLATEQEEVILVSDDREVRMGKSISRAVEDRFKVLEDERIKERINNIGERIVNVCDRKDIIYHFKVLDEKDVNAMALPGGYIYVNKGLIDKADSDDELACVIAHEVGHVTAKHSVKKLQGAIGINILRILMIGAEESETRTNADIALAELFLAYSREDELFADKLAVKYAKLAGYDPNAMLKFLNKLKDIQKKEPIRQLNYARTHPYLSDRIATVRMEISGNMGYVDYINKSKEFDKK